MVIPTFDVFEERQEMIAVVRCEGELDISSEAQLRDSVESAFDLPHPVVVIDYRGLRFSDSTSLRVGCEAIEQARISGKQLVIVPGEQVARIMDLCGWLEGTVGDG